MAEKKKTSNGNEEQERTAFLRSDRGSKESDDVAGHSVGRKKRCEDK